MAALLPQTMFVHGTRNLFELMKFITFSQQILPSRDEFYDVMLYYIPCLVVGRSDELMCACFGLSDCTLLVLRRREAHMG